MQGGDPSFVLQIAEKEQELLASQETVQVTVTGKAWAVVGHWVLRDCSGGDRGQQAADFTSVPRGPGPADEGEAFGALASAQERAHRRPLPAAPAGRA